MASIQPDLITVGGPERFEAMIAANARVDRSVADGKTRKVGKGNRPIYYMVNPEGLLTLNQKYHSVQVYLYQVP